MGKTFELEGAATHQHVPRDFPLRRNGNFPLRLDNDHFNLMGWIMLDKPGLDPTGLGPGQGAAASADFNDALDKILSCLRYTSPSSKRNKRRNAATYVIPPGC